MNPRKKAIAFLLFFAIASATTAQLQPVYVFQKDDSLLKKNYYEQSLKKKQELLASLGKEHASDYKKIYEEQFKEIGTFLQSSRTVTEPEAHDYLQSVVKKIITANNELKELNPRIIFSRDWWPNAYSMGEGTITVNAGLMIYLDNEAELVFVLCHELAHYYLDHSLKAIKKHVENINSESFKKEMKRLSKEEFRVNQQFEALAKSMIFDRRRHSRANEAEADRQAFAFMKKTGYDCGAIKTTLELLDKVDDSLLARPVNLLQAFDFPEYHFKKKWIEKESVIFGQLSEENSSLSKKEKDSLKTHPDCGMRISLLNDSLIAVSSMPGKKFQVDETKFNQLKKDFFIEMTEENYRQKNLGLNLYYSLLLLHEGQNVPVAVYSISRCLNRIYESQKNHTLGTMVDAENRAYPPHYNLLLRMLNRLRLEEIASLNYYFGIRYREQMKDFAAFREELNRIQKPSN